MMGGKVIEVIEGMLRGAQQMVGVLLGEDWGVNGDAEREDGTACLIVCQLESIEGCGVQTFPSAQSSICCRGRLAR